MRVKIFLILNLLVLLLGQCSWANDAQPTVTIVDKQEALAVIVLPKTFPWEQQTLKPVAEELRDYIQKMTGVEIKIITKGEQTGNLIPIFLGEAANTDEINGLMPWGEDPASFLLYVTEEQIVIRGLTPEGTQYGVYELLEQLGVRWFMPGDLGTVIPQQERLSVFLQKNIQIPSFAARRLQGVGHHSATSEQQAAAWEAHVRLGGEWFAGSHGMAPFRGKTASRLFQEHPEYFALVDGKRSSSQLCLSNPKVLELVIEATKAFFRANPNQDVIGMSSNDGFNTCECDNCRALDAGDHDPFVNYPSMSDRYYWFFNQVLKGIEAEFPDKKIATYLYNPKARPPVNIIPDPRIIGAVAPIAQCRVHGPSNPLCPEANRLPNIIKGWKEKISEVWYRGYWFMLADIGLPFIMVHRMRDEIPLMYELGIKGWRMETMPKWASETPSLYIAAKLMWDHTADVDALMQDFFDKFYGPASVPMGKYIMLLDHALRDADHHTGSSWDMPYFYPLELRRQAKAFLTEAMDLAGDGIYAERVKLAQKSFDFLENFIGMLEASARHDFVVARDSLERVDEIIKDLRSYDPPMLHQFAARYLQRFFRLAIEQGYARVTGGNELVAALNDVWQFQIDPYGLGEELGWHRPEIIGGNWQKIKSSSSSWGNQGLRYYKGEAWYRQTVVIPAQFVGKRVFLWFGGVDEKAKVFVNGKEIGISSGSAFQPFEMDATEVIVAGDNVVAVRLLNERTDELGTGGIVAPVMFYAPVAGDAAQLENIRDLGLTFP